MYVCMLVLTGVILFNKRIKGCFIFMRNAIVPVLTLLVLFTLYGTTTSAFAKGTPSTSIIKDDFSTHFAKNPLHIRFFSRNNGASPYVTSVGGTTLEVNSGGAYK